MTSIRMLIVGLLVSFLAAPAGGQIIIINPPPPPTPVVVVRPPPNPPPPPAVRPAPAPQFALRSITVEGNIRDLVAQIQVKHVVQNTSSSTIEAQFIFPIPPDAVVDRFTLMVDGQEFPARVYPKAEARAIYESIVRSRRDPALLEYLDWGVLQTSVFPIPPGANRELVLKYTQVCRRSDSTCDFLFPLSTAKHYGKPAEQLKIDLRITDRNAIRSVYSPNYNVTVDRPDGNTARVTYAQSSFSSPDDFRLFWTYSEKPIGLSLMSYKSADPAEDGYYLLLLAPDIAPPAGGPVSKTVVFTIDRSGSMSGTKIEQARGAARFVLNNLRPGDTFNIVAFDSQIETFKPELQRFDETTRKAALDFIDGLYAGGSTAIDAALRTSLAHIGTSDGRPAYLLFLTDGLPTDGEANETKIAANARENNKGNVRIFTFGVGNDLNSRLLERLATEAGGSSEYVKPTENIEASVARLFARLTAPVLARPVVEIAGSTFNRVYPASLPDLFAGGQVLAVGRYRQGGTVTINLTGKVGNEARSFSYEGRLAERPGDESYAFVEKLWAVRRVGAIIQELDLKGHNQELIDELVRLATRNGILTPYTSFLADDRTPVRTAAAQREVTERVAVEFDSRLRSGAGGFGMGGYGGAGAGMGGGGGGAGGDRAGAGGAGGMGGMGGGPGGGGRGAVDPAPYQAGDEIRLRAAKNDQLNATQVPNAGTQRFLDADGRYKEVSNCLVVNNQALFFKGGQWVDPSVTPEEERTATVIEPFSDGWYAAARDNAALRPFLTIQDGVVVRVQGRVYRINAVPRG
jgi:Ca-activated chloride channel family protein